jgi:hypothetical protein
MYVPKTARIFGWLFIATFVTSIGARFLFVDGLGASWQDMRFIPGAVSETSMYLGAILEFALIVTNIATAVVIYPIVRRQSEGVALGYVTARIMECVRCWPHRLPVQPGVPDVEQRGRARSRPHAGDRLGQPLAPMVDTGAAGPAGSGCHVVLGFCGRGDLHELVIDVLAGEDLTSGGVAQRVCGPQPVADEILHDRDVARRNRAS